ncbi:hypothetical protein PVK06_016753 [Gossypium arboreum]|uniref:Endonuclease/exonuclease/phosphatase domain-containing protein n=1 Tax=Gossypium arboreum TaxID=29729 RepID=A0ABR0Q0V3_GOSAR|nr:hypothetical protein PVK06_016753 [Gossypium arboreum]
MSLKKHQMRIMVKTLRRKEEWMKNNLGRGWWWSANNVGTHDRGLKRRMLPVTRRTKSSGFKAFFWNCQGCGHPRFCNFIKEYKCEFEPDLLALFETRISGSKADSVVATMRFDNSFKVEATGFSGGIWLFWNDNLGGDILKFNSQFVHMRIQIRQNHSSFLCTTVYASPQWDLREVLWDKLEAITVDVEEPWIMAGDFNVILSCEEMRGFYVHLEYEESLSKA